MTTIYPIISIFHYFSDSRKSGTPYYFTADDTNQFLTLTHQNALTFISSIILNLPGTKGHQQDLMSSVGKSILDSVLEGNNPHTLPEEGEWPWSKQGF